MVFFGKTETPQTTILVIWGQQQNEILIIIAVAATINFIVRVFVITIIIRAISMPDLFTYVNIVCETPPPPSQYCKSLKSTNFKYFLLLIPAVVWGRVYYGRYPNKVILTRVITIPVVNLSCTRMLALFTHFKFEEGFLKRIEKKKRTKPAIHQRRAELLPQQRIKARRISW